MYMCHATCVKVPLEARKNIRFPETEVIDCCYNYQHGLLGTELRNSGRVARSLSD